MFKRNEWYKLPALVLMTALLLLAAACGAKGEENSKNEAKNAANNAAQKPAAASEGTAYPLTVKDITGTELTFSQAPGKIITLVPSETEIVYALGAGDEVVAVDDNSNYPAEVSGKEKIGGMDAGSHSGFVHDEYESDRGAAQAEPAGLRFRSEDV
jgi:iron complex transport system substrate-binding protein